MSSVDNLLFVSKAFAIAVAPSEPILLLPMTSVDNLLFFNNASAIAIAPIEPIEL